MSERFENYEIMFAVYDTVDGASGAVDSLKAMDKSKTIDIVDAATLIKDAEGNTTVKQESLPTVKKGLGVGALIGGAVGLLFPPSILAAAAIGAGVGAGSAKLAQMALENDDLQQAAQDLEPGTSAFIAVVDNTWAKQLQTAITGYQKLAAHTLDAEASGIIGSIETDEGAAVYGHASSDDAAVDLVAVTDGSVVAAEVTAFGVGEDGTVVARQVEAVAATDAEGNVAAVGSDTIAALDDDGNVVVAQGIEGGAVPAAAIDAASTEDGDPSDPED